ncbi:DUF1629 domain-containing protein [Sphingobacterium sp. DR205]|uniref:imm11 family protein n=1 Tax=Sphingobacterium sp. DR205 TaxID=2713573 RepID=UPI0013E4EDE4|nr:DUF1629 domain-containing protein [Sphingobacterium sp. DR205]QIH33855.1 hypothetical protein G6053_13615 [Sphingobacterium sp. DR205]
MNYFLEVKSKPNLPFKYSLTNQINGSYLAVGKFIADAEGTSLIYEDAENSEVAYESLITLDVLTTVGGGILISERFKKLIEAHCKTDVQLFETAFIYKEQKNTSYFALNVFNKVDCYDLDQSVYSKHPVDGSYKFSKTVLKTGPLEEYSYQYHIVRSAENNKIVVSGQLKKILEDNKINSIGFKKG